MSGTDEIQTHPSVCKNGRRLNDVIDTEILTKEKLASFNLHAGRSATHLGSSASVFFGIELDKDDSMGTLKFKQTSSAT